MTYVSQIVSKVQYLITGSNRPYKKDIKECFFRTSYVRRLDIDSLLAFVVEVRKSKNKFLFADALRLVIVYIVHHVLRDDIAEILTEYGKTNVGKYCSQYDLYYACYSVFTNEVNHIDIWTYAHGHAQGP